MKRARSDGTSDTLDAQLAAMATFLRSIVMVSWRKTPWNNEFARRIIGSNGPIYTCVGFPKASTQGTKMGTLGTKRNMLVADVGIGQYSLTNGR